METELCSCEDIIGSRSLDYAIKAAALRVSPSLVSVITHDVTEEMIVKLGRGKGTYICPGSGIIIQCEESSEEGNACYSSTVLCPAQLFKRTDSIQPHHVQVYVRVSGPKFYKAQLLACDFHFNIAALTIKSDSPLCPATLRHLLDLSPLDSMSNPHPFKVHTGTKILIARRCWFDPFEILVYTGVLSTHDTSPMHCKELFSIKHSQPDECKGGGAIINYHGEVIGLFFRNGSVVPTNLVFRWWNHYKSCREFLRPCLGLKVANLHEGRTGFSNQFVGKFLNIASGVVVTEVEKDSPAHLAKIKRGDVIIKCNGDLIQSKLKLFEKVWDNASRVVKLGILKASSGDYLKLSMAIGETDPHKLYEWRLPDLCGVPASLKPGAFSVP